MLYKRLSAVIAATCLIFSPVFPGYAQSEGPAFLLELNNAVDTETGGCRLVYVATNLTQQELQQTAYEIAVFNAEGVVSQILVLEFGALIEGKTKVVQFDLPGNPCGALSRIVVNDVAACKLANGTDSDQCLTGLATSSRTSIEFGI